MTNKIYSKHIKVGELDIHYLTGGHGAPLVMLHGGSSHATSWMKNIVELSKNYTVYAPDLPGFGLSQEVEDNYRISELVEFVNGFSNSLGLQGFYLMGHSFGGGIALNYTLKFPSKVKKLVLVSSMFLGKEIALWVRFLSLPALRRPIGAVALAIMKGVKWIANLLLAPNKFVSPLSKASVSLGGKTTTLKEQTMVLANRLSEIMVPTLIVWGAKDPVLPVSQAYAAGKLIPNCQVKVFKDGGHSVHRQKMAEFSQLLTAFLG